LGRHKNSYGESLEIKEIGQKMKQIKKQTEKRNCGTEMVLV
jgi:hypothetical protein